MSPGCNAREANAHPGNDRGRISDSEGVAQIVGRLCDSFRVGCVSSDRFPVLRPGLISDALSALKQIGGTNYDFQH